MVFGFICGIAWHDFVLSQPRISLIQQAMCTSLAYYIRGTRWGKVLDIILTDYVILVITSFIKS